MKVKEPRVLDRLLNKLGARLQKAPAPAVRLSRPRDESGYYHKKMSLLFVPSELLPTDHSL